MREFVHPFQAKGSHTGLSSGDILDGRQNRIVDCLEGLRGDARPYFDGRAIGCIVTADGWQACGTTLSALRTIIHALRGWPPPLGVTFNPSAGPLFDDAGDLVEARDAAQIELLISQVLDFAGRRHVEV